MVADRMADCVSRAVARSGTALIAASSPVCGRRRDLAHRAQGRVHEGGDRVALRSRASRRRRSGPGPGSGVMSSIPRTVTSSPVSWSWMGSLLMKPVAALRPRPAATAAPCPKSGYSVIVRSAGVRPAELQERLQHHPGRAVLAGDAEGLALEVGRGRDPRRRLREHDRGELAVDRRHVLDRDALADGRDDARPVGDPDVDARPGRRGSRGSGRCCSGTRHRGRPRRSSPPGRRGRTVRTGRSG